MNSHRQILLLSQWFFCPDQRIIVPSPTSDGDYPASAPVGIEEIFWSLSVSMKRRGGHLDKTASLGNRTIVWAAKNNPVSG